MGNRQPYKCDGSAEGCYTSGHEAGRQHNPKTGSFNIDAQTLRIIFSQEPGIQRFHGSEGYDASDEQHDGKNLNFAPGCSADTSKGPDHKSLQVVCFTQELKDTDHGGGGGADH